MSIDLVPALRSLYPAAQWSLNGDSYAGLNWHGPGDKPGEAALLAEAERLAAIPTPRVAVALKLRYALNALGVRTAWDAALAAQSAGTRDYWDAEPNPPETSPKLKRIAAAAGVDLSAVFDAATAP